MEDQPNQSVLPWTLVVILSLLLLLAVVIIFLIYNEKSTKTQTLSELPSLKTATIISSQPTIIPSPATKVLKLDKKYIFPINDQSSIKLGEISFIIKDIERTKEVMVNGQKATAVGDRELVILNLELTNSQNLAVRINARNYIRLMVNGEEKLLAPDFHSDPVDLQPQSTKELRMGFSIAQADTNILLQVGELEGPKEIIKIE
jgi:hypothetical protein